jgi:hypothetical protein
MAFDNPTAAQLSQVIPQVTALAFFLAL